MSIKLLQKQIRVTEGFTLIELLVVLSIIVLLMAISVFGLAGARESARDQRRKADIETIRSAVELYRADCDKYPTTAEISSGTQFEGTQSSGGKCLTTFIYLKSVPSDPASATYKYAQTGGGTGYEICTTLEKIPSGGGSVSCGGSTSCGSSTCYYKATNP